MVTNNLLHQDGILQNHGNDNQLIRIEMAITKKQYIRYINVHDTKTLQVIGSKQIIEDGKVIAESELAFGLNPTETPSDRVEYQALPDSEKAKIDELVPLWTDEVKAAWTAKQAENTP